MLCPPFGASQYGLRMTIAKYNGHLIEEAQMRGASPHLIAVRTELSSLKQPPLWQFKSGKFSFEVHFAGQSLWIVVTGEDRAVAARAAYIAARDCSLSEVFRDERSVRLSIDSAVGVYHVEIDFPSPGRPLLHWRTVLAPTENLTVPEWPPDFYPLGAELNPLGTAGFVHTCQQGPTGAILYGTVSRPWTGSFLYVQNLSGLNDYFDKTHTSPADQISDRWPELGFRLPPSPEKALPAGQETAIADAYVLFTPETPADKLEAARLFLDLYAELYLALPRPEATFRDWMRRVDMTMRDLTHSPACSVEKNGQRYLLAYVGADDRPPESMVQLAVLVPLLEYEKWLGEDIQLVERLRSNLASFFNPDVKTVVRWLPGEERLLAGKEEHMGAEIMDSWYLYHTYLNLSRLAQDGDAVARRLFLKSVEYGIKVAHHFNYHWPVFYNIHTFEVIKAQTKPGAGGEHDVCGQYVHVMLQAWELTGERGFIEEAERAAQAMQGMGFDLGYQFNNVSFGAGGLLRLWKETGNKLYRDLSYVCLANFVSKLWLWECDYGHAENYHTFLGVAPLREAPYLALYEELEALAAFHDYLAVAGEDAPKSVRMLLCEYCKYLIDRAWYHYPIELPSSSIADKPRSGHINRELAIPLEDIYEGWQKAGQVGQEVYGAAAPFVFTTRHCHRVDSAPFVIHCDYPVLDFTIKPRRGRTLKTAGSAQITLAGHRRCRSYIRIVPDDYLSLPSVTVRTRGAHSHAVQGVMTELGYLEFDVPGDTSVVVAWDFKTQKLSAKNRAARVRDNRS
jgi:hypothetical protein